MSDDPRCRLIWRTGGGEWVRCERRVDNHGPRHTHGSSWVAVDYDDTEGCDWLTDEEIRERMQRLEAKARRDWKP